jgi:2-methylcitrate dehydratase PrpD
VSVRLDTYRSAVDFCDRPHPTTVHQAKFSLQHAVAMSLTDGAPWLSAFEPAAWMRADVKALREKISVNAAPDLNARFPEHYAARIAVTLRDGRTIVHEQHDALGDPEYPLDDAAILSKAKRLMDEAGWARAEDVVSAALALPAATSIAPFTQIWGGA